MKQQLLICIQLHKHTYIDTLKLVQFLLALFELWSNKKAYFEGEPFKELICIVVAWSTIEPLKSLSGIGPIEDIYSCLGMYLCMFLSTLLTLISCVAF